MANSDNRDWTVIVVRPGQATRNYSIGKLRRMGALACLSVVPVVLLAIGYQMGASDTLGWVQPAIASILGEAPDDPASAPLPPSTATLAATRASAQRDVTTRRRAPAAPPDSEQPDDRSSGSAPPQELGDEGFETTVAEPHQAEAEGTSEADEDGPGDKQRSLQLEKAGVVVEIVPYDADGQPQRAAFRQLRDAMACEDGSSMAPNSRLVRLLVDAHQRFGTPVTIRGGHCGAHDDQPEATRQHREGRAADIRLRGVSTGRLTDWLEAERPPTGLGRYAREGFVHVDVRPGKPSRWEPAEEPTRQASRNRTQAPTQTAPQPKAKPERKVEPAHTDQPSSADPPEPEANTRPPAAAVSPGAEPKPETPSGPTGAKPAPPTTRAKAQAQGAPPTDAITPADGA